MNKAVLTLLVFIPLVSFTQSVTEVQETIENIEDVNGNALQTTIYRSNSKSIFKSFKSLMKSYGGSVEQKREYLIASEVLISSISEHQIKVYAKTKEIDEKSIALVTIFLNGDNPISSQTDISSYTAAKEIIAEFSRNQSQNATEEYFKSEEKTLAGLEKELELLLKEKKKAEKEIEDCKKAITDNEYKIKENIDKQKKLSGDIANQKTIVKSARNETELFD